MGKGRALIASRLQRFLKPGNRFVEFALFDQIGSDVVIRIAEIWVLRDGLVTFFDRIVETPHKAVGPPEEGIGLGSRMSLDRFLVERHGFFQFALHLAFIGLLEELPRLSFIFFVAFALYEKILYVHSPFLFSFFSGSNGDGLDCARPTRAF